MVSELKANGTLSTELADTLVDAALVKSWKHSDGSELFRLHQAAANGEDQFLLRVAQAPGHELKPHSAPQAAPSSDRASATLQRTWVRSQEEYCESLQLLAHPHIVRCSRLAFNHAFTQSEALFEDPGDALSSSSQDQTLESILKLTTQTAAALVHLEQLGYQFLGLALQDICCKNPECVFKIFPPSSKLVPRWILREPFRAWDFLRTVDREVCPPELLPAVGAVDRAVDPLAWQAIRSDKLDVYCWAMTIYQSLTGNVCCSALKGSAEDYEAFLCSIELIPAFQLDVDAASIQQEQVACLNYILKACLAYDPTQRPSFASVLTSLIPINTSIPRYTMCHNPQLLCGICHTDPVVASNGTQCGNCRTIQEEMARLTTCAQADIGQSLQSALRTQPARVVAVARSAVLNNRPVRFDFLLRLAKDASLRHGPLSELLQLAVENDLTVGRYDRARCYIEGGLEDDPSCGYIASRIVLCVYFAELLLPSELRTYPRFQLSHSGSIQGTVHVSHLDIQSKHDHSVTGSSTHAADPNAVPSTHCGNSQEISDYKAHIRAQLNSDMPKHESESVLIVHEGEGRETRMITHPVTVPSTSSVNTHNSTLKGMETDLATNTVATTQSSWHPITKTVLADSTISPSQQSYNYSTANSSTERTSPAIRPNADQHNNGARTESKLVTQTMEAQTHTDKDTRSASVPQEKDRSNNKDWEWLWHKVIKQGLRLTRYNTSWSWLHILLLLQAGRFFLINNAAAKARKKAQKALEVLQAHEAVRAELLSVLLGYERLLQLYLGLQDFPSADRCSQKLGQLAPRLYSRSVCDRFYALSTGYIQWARKQFGDSRGYLLKYLDYPRDAHVTNAALVHYTLGYIDGVEGRLDAAKQHFQVVLSISQKEPTCADLHCAARFRWAEIIGRQGLACENDYLTCLHLLKRHPQHCNDIQLARLYVYLACSQRQSRPHEVANNLWNAWTLLQRPRDADPGTEAMVLFELGNEYKSNCEPESAHGLYSRALELLKGLGAHSHSELPLFKLYVNLGNNFRMQGQGQQAERYYCKALQEVERLYGCDHVCGLKALVNLSSLYAEVGNVQTGRKLALKAEEILKRGRLAHLPAFKDVVEALERLELLQDECEDTEMSFLSEDSLELQGDMDMGLDVGEGEGERAGAGVRAVAGVGVGADLEAEQNLGRQLESGKGNCQRAEVAEIVQALLELWRGQRKETVRACLELLQTYVANVLSDPTRQQYRKINSHNPVFRAKIATFPSALRILRILGFEETSGYHLLLVYDLGLLRTVSELLSVTIRTLFPSYSDSHSHS